jgi:hypothetical protein
MRSSQISAIFPYDLEAKASVSGLKSIAAASSDTYNYHYGFLFPHSSRILLERRERHSGGVAKTLIFLILFFYLI